MKGVCGPLATRNSWHGRNLLVRHLLLLCLAVLGMPGGLDADGLHNLLCFKNSCTARTVVCQWKAGNASKANYTLHLRYQESDKNRAFPAGAATSFSFDENDVYSLTEVLVWVESHAEDSRLVSEMPPLQLSKAVKFDAPTRKEISSSKANGTLTLKWPRPSRDCQDPIRTEARMRHNNTDEEWTRGNCGSREEEDDDDYARELIVLCHVEKDVPHEVQIRHRTSYSSSFWSEWSESLVIPAEIHESPKVTYTVGLLGSDGLRNVTLEWEQPSWEQGEVTYALTFVLLPCNCMDWSRSMVEYSSNGCHVSLSGAGYHISLEASNGAGRAPPFAFRLPPAEEDSGLPFLSSHLSGKQLSAEWAVKTDIEAYCFEAQPREDEALQGKPCIKEAPETHTGKSSATLEPNRCYRLAVHALEAADTDIWSTFALSHLFSRNTSLEEPIQIYVTNETTDSAILRWEPPKALSACPNALAKYVICCRNEQAGSTAYYEANASETHYMIRGLQPKTAYRVGVWASTDEEDGPCQPLRSFLTHPPGPSRTVTLGLNFWYLGIFGGLLTTTCIFCCGKKRAQKVLCSPLPDPADTEAVKVPCIPEAAQMQMKQGFIEPLESNSPAEPFLVELPSQEEPSASAKVDSPGGTRQLGEFLPPQGDPVGLATVLPLECNSQGLQQVLSDQPGFLL